MMTFDEFLTRVLAAYITHKEWRYGQALYNTLYIVRPELADAVCGSKLDPYHIPEEGSTAEFKLWLKAVWDK